MSALDQLRTKISEGSAVVGIYGLGYVGLPLALRFTEAGIKVIGFDIDDGKIQTLNTGRSYIERLGNDLITSALQAGFEATSDFARSAEAAVDQGLRREAAHDVGEALGALARHIAPAHASMTAVKNP